MCTVRLEPGTRPREHTVSKRSREAWVGLGAPASLSAQLPRAGHPCHVSLAQPCPDLSLSHPVPKQSWKGVDGSPGQYLAWVMQHLSDRDEGAVQALPCDHPPALPPQSLTTGHPKGRAGGSLGSVQVATSLSGGQRPSACLQMTAPLQPEKQEQVPVLGTIWARCGG